jgi:hypothetical protein
MRTGTWGVGLLFFFKKKKIDTLPSSLKKKINKKN